MSPVEALEMSKTSPADNLQIALVGQEGVGKSWLAATARSPVLFLDTDNRARSLAGKKDVYTLSFFDPVWPSQPSAASEILDVVSSLERSRKLKDIMLGGKTIEKFQSLGDTAVKTLVFDSTASTARLCMDYALYNNKDLRRTIGIGGKLEIHKPKSYDGWAAEMGIIESLYLRAMGLRDVDVIMTFHTAMEEADDSSQESPKFTGKQTVFPVRYQRLLRYFNEVWFLKREQNVPTIQVIPDWKFQAKTALPLDGKTLTPNIQQILATCGYK